MTDLLDPLTPHDCDLRDFAYMPLDVQRLCDSDLAALESPEACWAALLLWCKSWHQVPAASLPDDDRVLSKLTGYQRAPEAWIAIREGALRGWVKCSDGRLYHPTVAEKANESWDAKHRHAYTKLDERLRKKNKARGEKSQPPLSIPTFEQWKAMGRPLENDLFPPENFIDSAGKQISSGGNIDSSSGTSPDFRIPSAGIPPEIALKGKGKGKGEVNLNPPISPNDENSQFEKSKTRSLVSLQAFLDDCRSRAEKPIPEIDPVFDYAEKAGIPLDILRLHWQEFKSRYTEEGAKRYKDWRAVYRKSVRGNWLRLWYIAGDGTCALTTVGEQAKRTHGRTAA